MIGTRLRIGIVIMLSIVLFTGCFEKPVRQPEAFREAPSGQPMYLKNNLHAQKRFHRNGEATYRSSYANYIDPGTGHVVVPFNTPVTYKVDRGIRGTIIFIRNHKDNYTIEFEYSPDRMGMSANEYMDLITSPEKISINGFSAVDKRGIQEGKVLFGMSKDGVRTALGYPAAHATPSLDARRWTYWKNRFVTFIVDFDESGKVSTHTEY